MKVKQMMMAVMMEKGAKKRSYVLKNGEIRHQNERRINDWECHLNLVVLEEH